MIIELTDRASEQIKEMIKDEPGDALLRFGIKGGGCSGLSYSLGFADEVNEELDVKETINEIPMVFFNQDIPIIEGTKIDYKENMMGGGFSIDNPNAIVSCGCGSSFRTEQNAGAPGDC